MQGMDVDRVIVLGPCHRYYTRFPFLNEMMYRYCLLTGASKLETPCGVLDVDLDAQNQLKESVDVGLDCSPIGLVPFVQYGGGGARAQFGD